MPSTPKTLDDEVLTPGLAELVGGCLCGGDLWAVPFYAVGARGLAQHVRTVRVCDVCGQERPW